MKIIARIMKVMNRIRSSNNTAVHRMISNQTTLQMATAIATFYTDET